MPRRVFISVAEPSADQHAANLVRQLRALEPDLIIEGIGGPEMAAAGMVVHHDTVARAAMGFRSILRYVEVWRILQWTRRYFQQQKPDLQICVDSWTLNRNWARLAHEMKIPVMYYIAPQIWASRAGRIKEVVRYVDRVACILPFEEQVFREHGVEATFVGHPLFDILPPVAPRNPAEHFPSKPPIIGLIPGSRRNVVQRNTPHLVDVAERILAVFPDAKFLIPTMERTHDIVRDFMLSKFGQPTAGAGENGPETFGKFTLEKDKFEELTERCDLCVTVSGTATLHAAGMGAPLIVVYRVNPFLWHLLYRWVVKTRTYSLVNLLNDDRKKIVPEFIPWYGSNEAVAEKALEYLQHPEELQEQRERIGHVIQTLNKPGASRQAAMMALDLMTARADTRPVG
jgi:lipid-A-disaccharide synthase